MLVFKVFAFARGLDFDGSYYFIGQSKNRNYSKNVIYQNISIDSGIIILITIQKFLDSFKLTRSFRNTCNSFTLILTMSNLILKYKILIKTITWRIIASSISVLIVFYLTRDFTISLSIGIFETCLKTALYFFHENIG